MRYQGLQSGVSMRAFAASLVPLVLTACQQPAPSEQGAASTPAAASPIASTTPIAPTTNAKAIPEQFRGLWDNAQGNCNPASDLRLDVGAVSVEFYESLGTVTGVTVESPNSILVELAMEGEGERWERRTRFALSEDGTTLTPSDIGDAPPAAPMPRKRCER
jgi:hypothetical protein